MGVKVQVAKSDCSAVVRCTQMDCNLGFNLDDIHEANLIATEHSRRTRHTVKVTELMVRNHIFDSRIPDVEQAEPR